MRSDRISHKFAASSLILAAALGLGIVPAGAGQTPGAAAAPAEPLAVRGGVVWTMAGDSIKDGVVLIRDGRIQAVGSAAKVKIPAGVRTISAAVVTPGLVDAHSTVGFSGFLNQPHDQEQVERSEPMQPELRAVDGYNAQDRLVQWVRSFGVTTLHTGHGPGQLISGQTMVVKTWGDTVEEALLVPAAMVAATLGEGALADGDDKKLPGTRPKAVAMIRDLLVRARTYQEKMAGAEDDKHPDRNLRLETMGRVLNRELPLMITVQRHQDILSALRVAAEFNLRLVLDGAAEAYMAMDEIKAAAVPVIVHPAMTRAFGERENLSMETAAVLDRAGIPLTLQSGFEAYVPKTRVVLFEAAIASAYGLPEGRALAAITIDAARLLGVDDRVGSLEKGKDADLALYDGDPFEYTSHCTGVIIDGRVVSQEAR